MEEKYKVLASGIDSLSLAIDIHWKHDNFFKYLDENRALATLAEQDYPIKLSEEQEIYALIKPYGRKGHRWLVQNGDFDLSIGNWLTPISRPSILANIRSEALWRIGPPEVIDLLIEILTSLGADKIKIKPSRVDLCVDMTFPEDQWSVDLLPLKVTNSRFAAPYFDTQLSKRQRNQVDATSAGRVIMSLMSKNE